MQKSLKYLFTLAVPLALVGFGAFWLRDATVPGRSPAVAYDTAVVDLGAVRRAVATSGPVRARVTVSVGSQLSGQVLRLAADFNSEVTEGDILAELDDKTFVARVAQAEADLAMAESQRVNAEATLQRAEAVQRQAERAVGRQKTLASRGITAAAALDQATRDSEVAIAEIAVAKAQIVNARAQIAQRRAALEQARIDLERTRIRSPIRGTVIGRTVDVGQTVAASLQAPELFKIAEDLRRIRIEAQVNEADVGAIKEGNPATFTVDAYPERGFEGVVTQVRLAATELQSVVTYTVIVEAANDDRRLFPGMTANVQIETAKAEGVLRVPNDALRFRPRGVAGPSKGREAGDRGAARGDRQKRLQQRLAQIRDELQLTEEQSAAVASAMRSAFAEMAAARTAGGGGGGGGAPSMGARPAGNEDPTSGARQRIQQRIEAVLAPLLSEAQRPLFERWKRGRSATRAGTVWLLDADGQPIARAVRIGIADEQFTEVVGGTLAAGDRVVVRARAVRK
jgi:HlyD family secretion protein